MEENTFSKRKTIRIPDYDYSQNGYYFITICTQYRKKILSDVKNGKIILNQYGKIVEQEILKTNVIRENVKINNYVIMPNHLHMVIEITNVGVAWYATRKGKLERGKMIIPKVIQQFKVITQKIANKHGLHTMQPLQWQRGYYEHVIRGENEHLEICQYIENNPLKWEEDLYNE